MNALDRAREDIANDRIWKARERVAGRLCNVCDAETLTLLAEIHLAMKDLPAAGALFFALGRTDSVATQAIAVWEERTPDPRERWRSLPRMVRVEDADNVRALRVATGFERPEIRNPQTPWKPGPQTWEDRLAGLGCGLMVVLALAVLAIGWVGFIHWVWW